MREPRVGDIYRDKKYAGLDKHRFRTVTKIHNAFVEWLFIGSGIMYAGATHIDIFDSHIREGLIELIDYED